MPREQTSNSRKLTELDVLKSIDRKTDQVIKLLALTSIRDMNQTNKIKTLRGLGLDSPEIADYLGISASTVRVVLHRISKKPNRGGKHGK